jgi:hypothetical protein
MFFEFKHGGHALPEAAADGKSKALQKRSDTVTVEQTGDDFDPNTMTPFRYLLGEVGKKQDDLLPVSDATVNALDALGNAMIDPQGPAPATADSSIPPIFTYWSQFMDHELAARTDRDAEVSDITLDAHDLKPADRRKIEKDLLNRRTPALELDALYGDGPPGHHGDKTRRAQSRNVKLARKLRDGAKMRIGTAEVTNAGPLGPPVGQVPPPATDLHRDLPRIGALLDLGVVKPEEFPGDLQNSPTFRNRAFIGDPRNDENLAVAQFHVALLRFHNAVVDWLLFKDRRHEKRDQDELFEDARKIVRWTFQWLTVTDFLKTLLREDVVTKVLKNGAKLYRKQLKEVGEPFMPVEFAVAGYRFGHSLIRNGYDYNRNFGNKPDGTPGFVAGFASLVNFFQFTGKSTAPFINLAQTLPHNWIIEWDRFDGSSPGPGRVARKLDTNLATTLGNMPNEGNVPADAPFKELLKQLARRNLRRGYQLSLPTGQAVARALEVKPLSRDELNQNSSENTKKALGDGGFFDRTPLWFYILKEAEVRENGERLGEVGSHLVAETFIGVLLSDPESYLAKDPSWDPSKKTPGSGGPLTLPDGRTIKKIGDLLEFAGVKPPKA